MTRTERKQRHLRTAEHLRTAFFDKGAEVAEVIAVHLDDAYKAAGDDPDTAELKVRAATAHVAAGERAESIGGPEAAAASYLRAAELTDDETDETALLERAGQMAFLAGWHERALGHFEKAVSAHKKAATSDPTRAFAAARATAWLGTALSALGRGEEAISRIQDALTSLEGADGPPAVLAELLGRLGAALVFSGHIEEATAPIEEALTLVPAPRARRAAHPCPKCQGTATQHCRAGRGGTWALRAARHLCPPPRHRPKRDRRGGQPRGPLHDP
ncbi:MAG: hypothetical protein ACYCST_11895 [Acidimicrobiales bacterium]